MDVVTIKLVVQSTAAELGLVTAGANNFFIDLVIG
jgi:hypothetical protein